LYLCFEGDLIVNTAWNTVVERTEIPALPFSMDSDFAHFSEAEQAVIRRVWQRVAEDYSPFNINVTTERPASMNSRVAIALVTGKNDANGDPNPNNTVAGVAYVNVFGTSSFSRYRPAWIYHDNLGNVESYLAEAISHEIGHNMGLSHDGKTDGSEYYGGHGSGELSWGPIMGTGYNRNITQWSRGEYYLANNTQDDLAILAGKIGYLPDDHGNSHTTATPLLITDGSAVVSTTPESDPQNVFPHNKGILERNTDVDVFSFVTGTGTIDLSVHPWVMTSGTRGGNLDLRVDLVNETGQVLANYEFPNQTSVSIQTNLTEGRYFLHIKNSAAGNPLSSPPTGYSEYGSIGQYFIRGRVTEVIGLILPPAAELHITDLTTTGQEIFPFSVLYTDDVAVDTASIDSQDIRVTGPNAYDQMAEFISLNLATPGSPRTATYGIRPPNGVAWLPTHNGVYTVMMEANQVGDIEGAWVPEGPLGSFRVSVPMALYTANMDKDPGWTLDPQWQYGVPNYSGVGPSAGRTGSHVMGYNLNGNYANRLTPRYATTPPIDSSGSQSLTLRFQRWLRIRQNDPATIEVSTNGSDWLTVWNRSSAIADTGWTEVQYPLPNGVAGSPTVQIRWGLSSNPAMNDIGWNIDDVELLTDSIVDSTPPTAELNVANLNIGGSPSHACSVTYIDDSGIRLDTLAASNLRVIGPDGSLLTVEYIGVDLPDDGSPATASYSIAGPTGVWSATDNGTYTVVLEEGTISDIYNNTMPETLLGSFDVAIEAAIGSLQISPTEPAETLGHVGGPFFPAQNIYTLSNTKSTVWEWNLEMSVSWLDSSQVEGAIDSFTSGTVTVSIQDEAALLASGSYSAQLRFVHGEESETKLREWVLQVYPRPTWHQETDFASNTIRARLQGIPHWTYQLESSPDLKLWSPVSSLQADSEGWVEFIEPIQPSQKALFYRATLQNPS
jgi:hypothetical protein